MSRLQVCVGVSCLLLISNNCLNCLAWIAVGFLCQTACRNPTMHSRCFAISNVWWQYFWNVRDSDVCMGNPGVDFNWSEHQSIPYWYSGTDLKHWFEALQHYWLELQTEQMWWRQTKLVPKTMVAAHGLGLDFWLALAILKCSILTWVSVLGVRPYSVFFFPHASELMF